MGLINTAQFFLEISNVNDDFKGLKLLSFLYLFLTFSNWAKMLFYTKKSFEFLYEQPVIA